MKKAILNTIIIFALLFASNSAVFASKSASLVVNTTSQKLAVESQSEIDSPFTFKTTITIPVKDFYSNRIIVSDDNQQEETETNVAKKSIEKATAFVSYYHKQFELALRNYTIDSFAKVKEPFYFPSYNPLYIVFEVFRI